MIHPRRHNRTGNTERRQRRTRNRRNLRHVIHRIPETGHPVHRLLRHPVRVGVGPRQLGVRIRQPLSRLRSLGRGAGLTHQVDKVRLILVHCEPGLQHPILGSLNRSRTRDEALLRRVLGIPVRLTQVLERLLQLLDLPGLLLRPVVSPPLGYCLNILPRRGEVPLRLLQFPDSLKFLLRAIRLRPVGLGVPDRTLSVAHADVRRLKFIDARQFTLKIGRGLGLTTPGVHLLDLVLQIEVRPRRPLNRKSESILRGNRLLEFSLGEVRQVPELVDRAALYRVPSVELSECLVRLCSLSDNLREAPRHRLKTNLGLVDLRLHPRQGGCKVVECVVLQNLTRRGGFIQRLGEAVDLVLGSRNAVGTELDYSLVKLPVHTRHDANP